MLIRDLETRSIKIQLLLPGKDKDEAAGDAQTKTQRQSQDQLPWVRLKINIVEEDSKSFFMTTTF